MKHTKGNWEPIFKYYEKRPKKICLGVGINSKYKEGVYTEFICNSMLPDSDKEYIKQKAEIEANMKLIAAAPDLLKALQYIVDYWNSSQPNLTLHDHIEHSLKTAKEVIKKATT